MSRLALILALLLALPVAADPVPPSPAPEKPHASPAPPRNDEGELGEFVPSENVPADAAVAFPNDI
jgi:hypothetical protein